MDVLRPRRIRGMKELKARLIFGTDPATGVRTWHAGIAQEPDAGLAAYAMDWKEKPGQDPQLTGPAALPPPAVP